MNLQNLLTDRDCESVPELLGEWTAQGEDLHGNWAIQGIKDPVAEASWARIMISSRDYYVIGAEYFMSHLVGGDPAAKDKRVVLLADYKVIARPKRKDSVSRIFMLDKTASETRYFLEEFSAKAITMVATYGNEKPDIRTLAKAVADYLDKGQTDGPGFYPGRP